MGYATSIDQIATLRRSVGFDSYDITVRQLVDMVSEGQINISPEYQRHFVWDAVRQSQLVESLLLGIPIPSIFMATNKDATWEVIDGLQRLTTLMNFIYPTDRPDTIPLKELQLTGLEKLSSLNGAKFNDLPTSVRLQLMTRPMRITVLNDLSDHQVRFDLFERLNTGGIVLHEQEIRNCVYIGRFNNFIKECAQDESLRKLVKRTDISGRGNLEELTLKFFAFLEDSQSFTHSVKDFLNDYMEKKIRSFTNEVELRDLFGRTMHELTSALPGGIVRKDRPNTTPLLLFEAVAVGVASALRDGNSVSAENLRQVLDDEQLKKLTSGGTNSRPKLTGRIHLVRDAVKI